MSQEPQGKIYYGMHMYPGVAEYAEKDHEPYRVFLKENTIRNMGPSFNGRPVFVYHVDKIESDINELRKEADGWVVESFYNERDGKHWVKFIVVSDRGEAAIKNGMRLSNCYRAKKKSVGGTWNGISYDHEITEGEYDHLAIVPNPRYEESVIFTVDEYKQYNEDRSLELKRLANSKQQGVIMKFDFFKRAKVENSSDYENLSVMLPKSKMEVSIARLINEADEFEMKKGEPKMANPEHLVEYDSKKMSVGDLLEKYENAMCMKKNEEDEDEDEEDDMENEEDEEKIEKKKEDVDKKKMNKKKKMNEDAYDNDEDEEEEDKEDPKEKKKNASDKARRLRDADKKYANDDGIEPIRVSTSADQLARGKSLYGSSN